MTAPPTNETSRTHRVPVIGMTCAGCATSVRRGLSRIEGVSSVDVDESAGVATVIGDVDAELLNERVLELGYATYDDDPPHDGARGWRPPVVLALAALVLVGGIAGFVAFGSRVGGADAVLDPQNIVASASPLAFAFAFLLGLAVAFSPATLAMAPAVMGTVVSGHAHSRRRSITTAVAFVGGMLVVDVALGALFAAIGQPAIDWLEARLAIWFALMFLVLGGLALVVGGVWRPRLPSFLPQIAEVHSVGGAFAAGIPFGLLACPSCTPLLLPVILGAVATGDPLYGAAILGVYGIGRGLPLVAIGASAGLARRAHALRRHVRVVERTIAVLLALGALYFAFALVLTIADRGIW